MGKNSNTMPRLVVNVFTLLPVSGCDLPVECKQGASFTPSRQIAAAFDKSCYNECAYRDVRFLLYTRP